MPNVFKRLHRDYLRSLYVSQDIINSPSKSNLCYSDSPNMPNLLVSTNKSPSGNPIVYDLFHANGLKIASVYGSIFVRIEEGITWRKVPVLEGGGEKIWVSDAIWTARNLGRLFDMSFISPEARLSLSLGTSTFSYPHPFVVNRYFTLNLPVSVMPATYPFDFLIGSAVIRKHFDFAGRRVIGSGGKRSMRSCMLLA